RRRRARRPQTQHVDPPSTPARDRNVVRYGENSFAGVPKRMCRAIVPAKVFDSASESDGIRRGAIGELPWVAVGKPLFGPLLLPTSVKALLEQAVLVVDAVAIGGDSDSGHAVHEAGGEPSETAVAESRIGLDFPQTIEINAKFAQGCARHLDQLKVAECVEKQAADQKFDREIVDPLLAFALGAAFGLHPNIDDAIAYRERCGLIPIAVRCRCLRLAQAVNELGLDSAAKLRLKRNLVRRKDIVAASDVFRCGHLRLEERQSGAYTQPTKSSMRLPAAS